MIVTSLIILSSNKDDVTHLKEYVLYDELADLSGEALVTELDGSGRTISRNFGTICSKSLEEALSGK